MEYIKPDLTKARKRTGSNTEEIDFVLEDQYKNIGLGKNYHVITFGCQGNEADSEVMAGILEQAGYTFSEDPLLADVVLLNTCAVRENAEQ